MGNVFDFAVADGALALPRAEDRADGIPQLLVGVFGELAVEPLGDLGLELGDQFAQVFGAQFAVECNSTGVFFRVEQGLERVCFFFVFGPQAHDHVAVHLHEAAIHVVAKARVARLFDKPLDDRVVEAEIEHGLHHARHGHSGARAHGEQERVDRVAKAHVHGFFDFGNGAFHLVFEFAGIRLVVVVVIGANFGGDGKTGWDGQAELGHFGEVGSFAAEQIAHFLVAFGLRGAKQIYVLFRHCFPILLS